MFAWLVDNGWLIWLVVFLGLAVVEMLTLGLYFILMSVGALAAMVAYFLHADFTLQVVVFCVVAAAMTIFIRPVAMVHLRRGPADLLTNVDRLIGRDAVVVETIGAAGGRVKIGGDVWSARAASGTELAAGTPVVVSAIDGATAVVTSTTAAPTAGA
ncbi:NfeD family protein [Specibacter cremeus]|uniref:NfeD family protein n=1 Tax=Specibacter cremeus TaxID=1629051 RepID=UPI000F7B17D4|nr:NfeD family protein [Specibacter cremeus]